jgi:hypothetical protein
MKVDAVNIVVALEDMKAHARKLTFAAARAISKGEHGAAEFLEHEANGVDWCMRRLRLAMAKPPAGKGAPCPTNRK